ncbi:fungal-specific transcription factor domain-containing protein [Xylogone sp. PMI_703]|nr:fungal-specific transcription factor domain-containing protein [Xylogone sp. PMI_703]
MLENQSAPNQRPVKIRKNRQVACNYCRLKKIRCNGEQPTCTNCLDKRENCVYAELKRRKKKNAENNEILLDRISRLEAILKESTTLPQPQDYQEAPEDSSQIVVESAPGSREQQMPLSPPQTDHPYQSLRWTPPEIPQTVQITETHRRKSSFTTSSFQPTHESSSSPCIAKESSEKQNFEPQQATQTLPTLHVDQSRTKVNDSYSSIGIAEIEPGLRSGQKTPMDKSVYSIHSPEDFDWEYHGPGSYLSLCSKPGIDWVIERTGSSEFTSIAREFSQATTKELKLDKRISPERAPEPDRQAAWRYAKEYFDNAPEAMFEIVHRPSFEARLKAHFDGPVTTALDEDPAWYALRNVIYAHGCRYEFSQNSYNSRFIEAQTAGWQYFENALSKYSDLCFCRTGLMAVNALLSMAFYAESLSSPAIEYMLITAAVRLAQSKGLHRQPGSNWGISPQDTDHRNWIFWLLYIYEKHVSHRSGRASIIDDDDISCKIPKRLFPGSNINLDFCTLAAKHALISSQIGKRCSTVAAYRQTPEQVVQTACELDKQLREWQNLHPPAIRPGSIFRSPKLPSGFEMIHVLYLHFSYYGSLIGIHSIFTYPWSGMLGRDKSPAIRDQINTSIEIVAEASRSIILMTKFINDIYAWTPTWMAFYYPVLGLINLFVHVLKHPTASTAQSDVALMDVMAGHFARMEFASSGHISISIARELSNLARLAIKRASQNLLSTNERESAPILIDPNLMQYNQMPPEAVEYNLENIDMSDFDLENWSALLPSFTPGDMIDFNAGEQNPLYSTVP